MEKWKAQMQSENLRQRYKIGEFIKMISDAEPIKESDINIYFKIVEKILVFEENNIIVTLFEGTEIEVIIE